MQSEWPKKFNKNIIFSYCYKYLQQQFSNQSYPIQNFNIKVIFLRNFPSKCIVKKVWVKTDAVFNFKIFKNILDLSQWEERSQYSLNSKLKTDPLWAILITYKIIDALNSSLSTDIFGLRFKLIYTIKNLLSETLTYSLNIHRRISRNIHNLSNNTNW